MERCGASRCFTMWDPGAMRLFVVELSVCGTRVKFSCCMPLVGLGRSRFVHSWLAVWSKEGRPWSALAFVSSNFFFYFFLSWRSWRRGGTGALVAVASAMRRIGVAFLCAGCCWGDGCCSTSSSVRARSLRRFIFSPAFCALPFFFGFRFAVVVVRCVGLDGGCCVCCPAPRA
jgi:hypothetical protein